MANLKQKTVHGFFWAILERFGTQAVTFVVSMVLARLLTPSDYGAVALLSIFIIIAETLSDAGFGGALVQKKNAAAIDFNTVFCISMSVAMALYAVLFFSAPWISAYFKHPELAGLFRVQALALFFHSFAGVQGAEMSRRMLFKLSFRISIATSIVSSVVGVCCAFAGLGPWALVWMSFSGAVVGLVIRLFVLEWRPRIEFSLSSAKGLWQYGWKITLSGLLDTAYNNLYGFLIGRFYSSADLAFVNKGRSIPSLAMNSINGTIGRVAFPALTQLQDERLRLREAMRRMMQISTFIVFPMMAGLAVCAPSLVPLLFGDQWGASVIYVQLACVDLALYPFHTINLQGIKAIGRSDWFLYLEIAKKFLGVTLVVASIRYGVFAMMFMSACVGGPLCVLINAWPNRKLLSYPVWMQIRDVFPSACISLLMAALIFQLNRFPLADWQTLAVQIPVGAAVYALAAWLFRLKPCCEAVRLLSPVLEHVSGFNGRIRLGKNVKY